jgi:hypothetical protein
MSWRPFEVPLDRVNFKDTLNVFPSRFEAYPRVFTHVTKLENLESIKEHGFKPGALGYNYFAKYSSRGIVHYGANFREFDLCAIAVCVRRRLAPPTMLYHEGTQSLSILPEVQPPIIAFCRVLTTD